MNDANQISADWEKLTDRRVWTTENELRTTMAVEDIKLTLPELLDSLTPGDEVILTRNQRPVAKLMSEVSKTRQPR